MSKPNAIVYLRRNDLIIGGKKIDPGKLNFTSDLVNFMEVKNPDVFIGSCESFFNEHNFKGKKVLLVLDHKIVFSKIVDVRDNSEDEIREYIESYIDAMPIKPGYRSCINHISEQKLYIFATNSQLYLTIIDALKLAGIKKLIAVSPAEAFDIDFSAKSSEIVNQFLIDRTVRKIDNFSTAEVI